MNTRDYLKIFILGLTFYAGLNFVAAQVVDAPNNPANTAAPLRVSTGIQNKLGPLRVNMTTTNPTSIGLNVGQGFQIFSNTGNWARYYLDELGDGLGNWSGIEFRKSGAFRGGLFKRGGSDLAQQDIAIWNSTKPVLTLKQNDSTEFAGTLRIRGGNPQPNYVLTSDANGLATWKPQTEPVNTTIPRLSDTIYQYSAYLSQNSPSQAASSCPDGELMVGFMTTVQGITGGGTGKVFCRKIVYN